MDINFAPLTLSLAKGFEKLHEHLDISYAARKKMHFDKYKIDIIAKYFNITPGNAHYLIASHYIEVTSQYKPMLLKHRPRIIVDVVLLFAVCSLIGFIGLTFIRSLSIDGILIKDIYEFVKWQVTCIMLSALSIAYTFLLLAYFINHKLKVQKIYPQDPDS